MLENIKALPGMIREEEVEFLHWLGKKVPAHGIACEIGSYRGKSTAAILSGLPQTARIAAFDPWMLGPPTKPERGEETLETVGLFRQAINPWKDRVIQVIGWPTDCARIWDGYKCPIDLLFVDALKDFDGVSAIWRAWLPKCRGWIATHDYQQGYEGIERLVEEILIPACDRTTIKTCCHIWAAKLR